MSASIPKVTTWQGRVLLWWAAALQRTVAGDKRCHEHKRHRNRAMRAAHARGITPREIQARTGLGAKWVQEILEEGPTDR